MTYVTDESTTEHVTVSDTCTCEPFDAVYTLRDGALVCLTCKKPRPVVVLLDDECPACHGRGCAWCSSFGCLR